MQQATLDIPLQKAKNLPLGVRLTKRGVDLSLEQPNASFSGILVDSGGTRQLRGKWWQKGRATPLVFVQHAQTPQPPFPYTTEEVTFTNAVNSVRLAGTLTGPQGKGPFPAVVLLTGSGPQDRNSTVFGHQPFWVLADYLTRHGIAVLRFDDQGVGQSGGKLSTWTIGRDAGDAVAALEFVRHQAFITKDHVGLLGHSSGGSAAILAAGRAHGPDFLVLLATPGLPGEELVVQQVLAAARLHTQDAAKLAGLERQQRALLRIVQQNQDDQQARTQLLAAYEAAPPGPQPTASQKEQQIRALTSVGYRSILANHPTESLGNVRCPVLALNGTHDVQVLAQPNLAAIAAAMASHNQPVDTQELIGLNHLFQTSTTGSSAEYGTNAETFSPEAMLLLSKWIAAHTGR